MKRELEKTLNALERLVESFEPCRYTGEEAARLVECFSRGKRLCTAGETLAARRVESTHFHAREGHRDAMTWLAAATGESKGQAFNMLETGRHIEKLPEIEEAFRAGRLSGTQAKEVVTAAVASPDQEHELLEAAEKFPMATLKVFCQRVKHAGASEEEQEARYERIRAARSLRHYTDREGAVCLQGRLTPDGGARFLAALATERRIVFEAAKRAGNGLERQEAYDADALLSLAERAAGLTAVGPDNSSGDESVGNDADAGPLGGRRPPNMTLRVDLAAFRRGWVEEGELCEIAGIGPIPVSVANSVLGDAFLRLVITDGVDVVNVTHIGRLVNAHLRTALEERDPTCVVPGCTNGSDLEIDHWRQNFAKGGATELDNLARVCQFHHYLRTHKGFNLGGGPGKWEWIPPPKNRTNQGHAA